MTTPVRPEELHAFLDGEVPPDRAAALHAALRDNADLAAFRADKAALAAAYAPTLQEPVPAAWIARIQEHAAPAPKRRQPSRAVWIMAMAASIVLAVGGTALLYRNTAAPQPILAQAEAARLARAAPASVMTGARLRDAHANDTALATATGLPLHAPDLSRLGWQLTEIDTYRQAAALRYRQADGRALTLYVRKSDGTPRFDLLKAGRIRTCIWQDEVVGAVMMGDMSAGQMMRVASAAYGALNL